MLNWRKWKRRLYRKKDARRPGFSAGSSLFCCCFCFFCSLQISGRSCRLIQRAIRFCFTRFPRSIFSLSLFLALSSFGVFWSCSANAVRLPWVQNLKHGCCSISLLSVFCRFWQWRFFRIFFGIAQLIDGLRKFRKKSFSKRVRFKIRQSKTKS